jgi:hypothetical protein
MEWKLVTHFEDGTQALPPWQEIHFQCGRVILNPRPHYCDRGNFLAYLDIQFDPKIKASYVDGADNWPRYYFDETRAKLEIEAWIQKRGLEIK